MRGCCTLLVALVLSTAAEAGRPKILKVAPTLHTGELEKGTYSSLHEAQAAAREWNPVEGTWLEIHLLAGRHELESPLTLDSRDAVVKRWKGSESSPTSVSGGRIVSGWSACPENSSWLCSPPLGETLNATAQPRHLYVNGRRAERYVAVVYMRGKPY